MNKPIAENKKARFDYNITETLEAGIVLLGSEVKSLRLGKASIRESYASQEDGELVLINFNIPVYDLAAKGQNHEPKRFRKLLLHKKEILKLKSNTEKKGMTIIPLSIYLKGSWIKLNIGIGKGKKLHDKRQADKNKSINKEINSALKR